MVRPRLVAIVGPTGSGKSALAVEVASALGGEIINADAYSLYRGLDIGTAKVDAEARQRVPHQLIDVAEPNEPLTLARYLDTANAALADIWSRNRLPVLAGGSGQYVWALIEGWQVPRVPPDLALRAELEDLAKREGPEAVLARLEAVDPEAAQRLDARNLRRLVRAVEVVERTGLPLAACQTRRPLDADVLGLGLRWPREALYTRLDERVGAQFAAGLVEEVRQLRARGFAETPALRDAVGYRQVSAHLDGEISLEEAVARTKTANHRLVRRQGAWFKDEDPRIHWLEAGDGLVDRALEVLRAWIGAETLAASR